MTIRKITIIILVILFIGILYRLALTANGSFLFNMDNARDMVDVREMVMLGKLRLTGPTSAVEGLYNGPAWYYLLSLPFIISGGDPYYSILMEIVLWTIGGFFLLKLVSRWGSWLVLPVGSIWIASNYIVLANLYAFNPNPVTLLSPLFIFLLVKYLENNKSLYVVSTWFLAGLFFNFEMNFGIFMPPVIFTGIVFTKNTKLLKQKWFWFGVGVFILTLLPQVLFDFKHQFIMSKAILRHLSENSSPGFNLLKRFEVISTTFYNTFLPILMNHKLFTGSILLLFIPTILRFLKERKKDALVVLSLIFILIPFIGYLFLPVSVNPWHLGGEMAISIILIAYILKMLMNGGLISKLTSAVLSILIVWFGISNIADDVNMFGKPNLDPSLYRNEIGAIDFVYKYANGVNFKAYAYLPSVYDYPYQYLFWWYGQKKYGYIPGEYVYSPNKPVYIPGQEKFQGRKDNLSGLVFLIKEPDRILRRQAWEDDFKNMKFILKQTLGNLEIEVRRE